MKSLQDSIKFKEQKIINLDKDSETVESQVNKEKHKFSKILNMKENYSVRLSRNIMELFCFVAVIK